MTKRDPTAARQITRQTLDRQSAVIAPLLSRLEPPQSGWIRAIRTALGLSADALADRLGVSRQSVERLELGEVSGTAQVATLRQAAEALDCDLYCIVISRRSLESRLTLRATHVALVQSGGYGYRSDEFTQEDAELARLVTQLKTRPTALWNN